MPAENKGINKIKIGDNGIERIFSQAQLQKEEMPFWEGKILFLDEEKIRVRFTKITKEKGILTGGGDGYRVYYTVNKKGKVPYSTNLIIFPKDAFYLVESMVVNEKALLYRN